MTRQIYNRGRSSAAPPEMDLTPVVNRTLRFLENSPRGASRKDILAAMNLQNVVWPSLREALEATGQIISVGRGPGLRHVHKSFLSSLPENSIRVAHHAKRSQELQEARGTLREVIQQQGEMDSRSAQDATGLKADPVRRLLLEMVDEGVVERTGKKRSTRYRWIG